MLLKRSNEQGLEPVVQLAVTPLCDAFGRSGIGGRNENQDSFDGATVGDCVILTVCDGMGGMNGGQTASSLATNEIVGYLRSLPAEKLNGEALREAIRLANDAIYRCAAATPALRGMGTTATIAVFTPHKAYVAHVGDSRIYQLRKGRKHFRTFDHSKVFDMVSNGLMTEEQARQSNFSNIITRALGIWPNVEPAIAELPYRKGDRFLLCSDGIWNGEPEPQMLKLFTENAGQPKAEAEQLTLYMNALGYERGAQHDNLTVIVAEMKQDSKEQPGFLEGLKQQFAQLSLPWKKKK